MRDFLQATREGIVVFDGGMGATLEMFDLSQEDYGGLQGKCHEALVLNRPDVIQGVHESMVEAGAEVVDSWTPWITSGRLSTSASWQRPGSL